MFNLSGALHLRGSLPHMPHLGLPGQNSHCFKAFQARRCPLRCCQAFLGHHVGPYLLVRPRFCPSRAAGDWHCTMYIDNTNFGEWTPHLWEMLFICFSVFPLSAGGWTEEWTIGSRCWTPPLGTSTPPWWDSQPSWPSASCKLGLCMAGSCSRWNFGILFNFLGFAQIFTLLMYVGEEGPWGRSCLSGEEQRGEEPGKKDGAGACKGKEGQEGGGGCPSWGRSEDQGQLKRIMDNVINDRGGFLLDSHLSQSPTECCLKFTWCLLRATFLLRCFYFYNAPIILVFIPDKNCEESHWESCNRLHFSILDNRHSWKTIET